MCVFFVCFFLFFCCFFVCFLCGFFWGVGGGGGYAPNFKLFNMLTEYLGVKDHIQNVILSNIRIATLSDMF